MKMTILKEPSLLREGVIHVLQKEYKELEINGYGSSDYTALLQKENDPDLVLIDLAVNINVTLAIKYFKKNNKRVMVWLTNYNADELVWLFNMGLDGYFHSGMEKEELLLAFSAVLNGNKYVHPSLSTLFLGKYTLTANQPADKPRGMLSNREWQVLELVTQGYKNVEISEKMQISEKTVKNHVSSILKKMNASDRTNAVLIALRNKWFLM